MASLLILSDIEMKLKGKKLAMCGCNCDKVCTGVNSENNHGIKNRKKEIYDHAHFVINTFHKSKTLHPRLGAELGMS